MSYGIVRIQKFSINAVGGIQIHDKRLKEGISHTNQDIDWTKTDLNFNFEPNKNYHKAIKERINSLNLKRAVRKDAVVMVQCLVTSDHTFFEKLSPQETIQFFWDSYRFLCERYGSENVISATVHLDELTPHMHFNFVPVTPDGRLSAKSLLTPKSLREQQTEFHQKVGMYHGLQRGEPGGKKNKHLDVTEYKVATAYQAQKELQKLQTKIADLSNEFSLMQGKLLSAAEIHAIRPNKGLLGGLTGITMDEFSKIKGMAIRQAGTEYELNCSKNALSKLQSQTREPMELYVKLVKTQKALQNALLKQEQLQKKKDELEWKLSRMEETIKSDRTLYEAYQEAYRKTAPWYQEIEKRNQKSKKKKEFDLRL